MRPCIPLVILSILAFPATAQTTRLVPSQYATIQSAVVACVNGDNVLVAPGTHTGPVSFLGKAINVHSSGGALVTTIVGAAGARVVSFTANETAASILDGFTITGGGGGIICQNSSPVIQNCRITGNSAPTSGGPSWINHGGGISCIATSGIATPSVSNCVISGNFALAGGGLYAEGTATLYLNIANCSFVGNSANTSSAYYSIGGGIALKGSACSALINGCTIDSNFSSNGGSGVYIESTSTITIVNCRVTNNTSINSSAGIESSNASQLALTSSLIVGNVTQSTYVGSALHLTGTTAATIKACTISGNHSSGPVGGLTSGLNTGSVLTINSSILWGNDNVDVVNWGPGSLNMSFCNIGSSPSLSGPGNISADPLFLDAAAGDYHLASVSPCRNAGTPGITGLPAVDLDGGTRIVGGIVDMGCDEVPLLARPGTGDGFDLYTRLNGAGDPLSSTRTAAAGSLLNVRLKSTTGTLVGGLPLFAVQLFANGFPPVAPPSFPSIWLDGQAIIVYGAFSAPPFSVPGLSPYGMEFNFTVPPGLGGLSLRMQGAVSTVNALNTIFAASNATDIQF